MNINLNQIIAYALYLVVIGVAGYVTKEWKAHNKKVIELQQKADERADAILGQQTADKAKKIVSDAVYEFEQLGKENDWAGVIKHTKVLEFVEDKLKKLSGGAVILTDDEIFDIIKTTIGYINANKNKTVTNITSIAADPTQLPASNTQVTENTSANVETPSVEQTTPGASAN